MSVYPLTVGRLEAVGRLPGRARRNEEHDQARVRCPLEKVRISFLPFHTPIPSGVCQGLHFFASIGLQEQHWVLTRGFHVPRSHKVTSALRDQASTLAIFVTNISLQAPPTRKVASSNW